MIYHYYYYHHYYCYYSIPCQTGALLTFQVSDKENIASSQSVTDTCVKDELCSLSLSFSLSLCAICCVVIYGKISSKGIRSGLVLYHVATAGPADEFE